jgi:hypothetical protein
VVSTLDCWCPVPGSILTRWLLIPVLGSILTQSPLPPVQPRSRSYHSTRSGPALDDSRDEYCIITYESNLEKNIKEKNKNSTYMLLRKFRREKTLGEMWAAVIRTINDLLRMAWLWTRAPDWGQSWSQLMLKRGPCWTYSRGASRRRKPTIAQVVYKSERGNHSKYHHCCYVVSWLTSQKQNSHIEMQQPDNE